MAHCPGPTFTPSCSFEHTGWTMSDYVGAILVCLSTKAVHVDVVSNYTTESFMATMRRFVSRRKIPHSLYSDCGTNFAGAVAELRRLFTASSRKSQRIVGALAEERIR